MSAAPLNLHLRALGLCLEVVYRPERGDGCKIKTSGLKNLPSHGNARVRQLIPANEPVLIALLRSGSPAALAIRREGGVA